MGAPDGGPARDRAQEDPGDARAGPRAADPLQQADGDPASQHADKGGQGDQRQIMGVGYENDSFPRALILNRPSSGMANEAFPARGSGRLVRLAVLTHHIGVVDRDVGARLQPQFLERPLQLHPLGLDVRAPVLVQTTQGDDSAVAQAGDEGFDVRLAGAAVRANPEDRHVARKGRRVDRLQLARHAGGRHGLVTLHADAARPLPDWSGDLNGGPRIVRSQSAPRAETRCEKGGLMAFTARGVNVCAGFQAWPFGDYLPPVTGGSAHAVPVPMPTPSRPDRRLPGDRSFSGPRPGPGRPPADARRHRRPGPSDHGADRRQGPGPGGDRRRPAGLCPGLRRAQRSGPAPDHRHHHVWRLPDQGGVRLCRDAAGRRRDAGVGPAHRDPAVPAATRLLQSGSGRPLCRLARTGRGRALARHHPSHHPDPQHGLRQFRLSGAGREAAHPFRSRVALRLFRRRPDPAAVRHRAGTGRGRRGPGPERGLRPLRHDPHQSDLAARLRRQPGRRLERQGRNRAPRRAQQGARGGFDGHHHQRLRPLRRRIHSRRGPERQIARRDHAPAAPDHHGLAVPDLPARTAG
uniref:LigA n=1 Tax=Parastrongyloides trichosuri TaxID=131310 RepID=A0A0N4ZXW8_PARTI